MDDFDDVPVRLPSGSRAVVRLPRPFTTDDAAHLITFLSGYIEQPATHPDKEARKR